MYTRKIWLTAGVALVCASVGFLFKQTDASAQTKVEVLRPAVAAPDVKVVEALVVQRYHMAFTGVGSTFIVIDTATGRCWKTSPDKREWQDIGAPPAIPRPYVPIPPPVRVPVAPPPK